jgi:hypothetical protein
MPSKHVLPIIATVLVAPCAFSQADQAAQAMSANDPIKTLVGRLDLQRYKATIRGLTKFGDRREGTDRNRQAIDWIEAQLKSYGCTNTERIHYEYRPAARGGRNGTGAAAGGRGADANTAGGGRGGRGVPGGAVLRGDRGLVGVNNDPDLQPDTRLRQLNSQPSTPGPREEVYCTKIGAAHPEEMYIIAPTWMALAGAKRPTTMGPARRL